MMQQGVGFSTGKIILTGEHSVVYGYPAVVSAISQGITVKVVAAASQNKQTRSTYQSHILDVFSQRYTVDTKYLHIETESTLSTKSGLGSSAAFAHAVIQALLDYFSLSATQEEIYTMVFDAESFIHKNPSGIDPCAVVYGGSHSFQKEPNNQVHKKQLRFAKPYTFVAINSGKAAESTGKMVQQVAELHKRINLSTVFSKMGLLSTKIASSLQEGTFSGDLFDENQAYLEEIGVVGTAAQKIITEVKNNGGSAKVTGAGGVVGGSGWILAYSPSSTQLQALATASGWESFTSTVQ